MSDESHDRAPRRVPGSAVKPLERIAIVARDKSRDAVDIATELADWLERRGLAVALDQTVRRTRRSRSSETETFKSDRNYDLVVVLGGDGTLLSVARSVALGVPILGVNLGRLGFLTELTRSELYPSLVKVLSGEFEVEKRTLFDVDVERANGPTEHFRAFNDAVIAKSALARIIEMSLEIGGHLVARLRADGLIISTPNGSTAYNLSAGGPIVYPPLPVAVVTPICAHALSLRPLVVPDDEPVEVVLESALETEREEVFLTVDGQEGTRIGTRDRVRVRRAPSPVHLVRMSDRSFYDSLRLKLKWGG